MKLKLSWLQCTILRAALPDLKKWLRERALNLPNAKKTELAFKFQIKVDEIELVQAALQEQAIAALEESL